MPIHCSTTGDAGERFRVSPTSSRTLRRIGVDLVVAGALSADHADRGLSPRVDGAGEDWDRRPALAATGRDQIVVDISGRDDVDRERQDVRGHQPGEMRVHCLGLSGRVGEDRAIVLTNGKWMTNWQPVQSQGQERRLRRRGEPRWRDVRSLELEGPALLADDGRLKAP